ncbi:MAG: hypothetical protein ACR2GY_11115 [Phycisphaerales bacterium]
MAIPFIAGVPFAADFTFVTFAQDPIDLQQDLLDPSMRPVEQGVDDVGPLSESLRLIEPGLDPGSAFDQVYEVPGQPDLFMRVDGGLHAVFRRSLYSEAGALVPSDTVFSIGPPVLYDRDGFLIDPLWIGSAGAQTSADGVRPPQTVFGILEPLTYHPLARPPRAGRSAIEAEPNQSVDAALIARTIANDPGYRARRLARLMQRAARAE